MCWMSAPPSGTGLSQGGDQSRARQAGVFFAPALLGLNSIKVSPSDAGGLLNLRKIAALIGQQPYPLIDRSRPGGGMVIGHRCHGLMKKRMTSWMQSSLGRLLR